MQPVKTDKSSKGKRVLRVREARISYLRDELVSHKKWISFATWRMFWTFVLLFVMYCLKEPVCFSTGLLQLYCGSVGILCNLLSCFVNCLICCAACCMT